MTDNIKAHICEPCGKNFGRKGTLERHFKLVHRNIRAFKCDACSKNFGQKHHLERHVQTWAP